MQNPTTGTDTAQPTSPAAHHRPRRGPSASRGLAQIAVFAALIAVLGLPGSIPLPGLVPITAQTLGVMLAGAVLGPWRGAASLTLFLGLVAMGLPLLSGGRGGLGAFVGPSAGFLIAWVLGALVVGLVVHAGASRGGLRPTWLKVFLASLLGGVLVIYLVGIPVQSLVTGLSLREATIMSAAFLPGDLIKAVLAAVLTMALWKAYPRAFTG